MVTEPEAADATFFLFTPRKIRRIGKFLPKSIDEFFAEQKVTLEPRTDFFSRGKGRTGAHHGWADYEFRSV